MPIEVTSSGGRLTKKVRRNARINDTEAILSVLDSLRDSVPFCELVKYWGEVCRDALKHDGIVADDHKILEEVEARGFKHPDAQWYEAEIFHDAKMIETIVYNGDIWTALGFAVKLGEKVKLYKVRHYDERLETGVKVVENLNDHGDKAIRRSKQKAARWHTVPIKLAKAKWKERPNRSAREVAGLILRDVQATVRTREKPLASDTVRKLIARHKPQKVGKSQ
jgi:hypothetical protein